MGLGSYARFAIGLALSLEILRSWFSGQQLSILALGLAVAFLILSILFFIKRI